MDRRAAHVHILVSHFQVQCLNFETAFGCRQLINDQFLLRRKQDTRLLKSRFRQYGKGNRFFQTVCIVFNQGVVSCVIPFHCLSRRILAQPVFWFHLSYAIHVQAK